MQENTLKLKNHRYAYAERSKPKEMHPSVKQHLESLETSLQAIKDELADLKQKYTNNPPLSFSEISPYSKMISDKIDELGKASSKKTTI